MTPVILGLWMLAAVAADSQTPATNFTTTGAWAFSSLPGYEAGKASLWSNDPNAAATWRPGIRSVAPVRLSLWLGTRKGNDRQAQVEIVSGGKTQRITVNMEEGEPRWLTLGKFDFAGKGEELVRVRHGNGGGHLRLSALKAEILDAKDDTVWQTLVFDDLVPYDPGVLAKAAPAGLRGGPPNPELWELAFSDDFDGDRLNTEVWRSAQGESWGALQSARFPENAVVSDGLLRLVTRKENRGGKPWTSAMISSRTFRQKYGYWESRYRYAAATGLNQAFWMHPGVKDKTKSFEIDVNEGHFPNAVNATFHQGGLESKSKRYLARYDLAADFHIYAAEWNEAEVIFYFDGEAIHRVPNTKGHLEAPVLFSTAVLPWAGPITDKLDGASMDVDWVRVYRRKSAEELDLGAMVQPAPMEARFSEPGYFVWCGAPTKGSDGKYHLYYSRWPVSKGFAPGWAIWSEIAYAVADNPLGPYKHVNVALPARGRGFWDGTTTHNPNVLQHDGRFYLFYMGNTGDGQSYPLHRNNQRIGVAVANDPAGPWKRFDKPVVDVSEDKSAFDSLCVTNPAAAVRPDGGILLIYKAVECVEGKPMGGKVRYGAALADKPEGPYAKTPGRIFEAEGDASKVWMLAEDPFIWFSPRFGNRYYAVARDVVGRFTGSSGGLALFRSDDGLHWQPATQPKVLESRFQWADGTTSNSNAERPALLFDGETPVALFGATDGYLKNGRIACNVQIPLTALGNGPHRLPHADKKMPLETRP